jgi:hypothetical protein
VLAGGHVDLQYVRRYGVSLVVNPGSAGLSYDHEQPEDDFRFDPFACYARITTGPDRIDVAFRRIRFDPQAVIDAVLASGIPYGAETAAQWRPR